MTKFFRAKEIEKARNMRNIGLNIDEDIKKFKKELNTNRLK